MIHIGIAGILTDSPKESPFSAWKRDITSQAYTNGVVLAGGVPVQLPILSDDTLAEEQISLVDGLLLQGGDDVEPELYGQKRNKLCGPSSIQTDIYQIALINAARKKGIPIFGICKGLQIINVALGGTLYQDYKLRTMSSFIHNHYENATQSCHQVTIEQGSFLDSVFHQKTLAVNSLHHQVVDKLGDGLQVAALSTEDGGIEAIENPEERIYAVQWHPEAMLMASSDMLPLWKFFIDECKR